MNQNTYDFWSVGNEQLSLQNKFPRHIPSIRYLNHSNSNTPPESTNLNNYTIAEPEILRQSLESAVKCAHSEIEKYQLTCDETTAKKLLEATAQGLLNDDSPNPNAPARASRKEKHNLMDLFIPPIKEEASREVLNRDMESEKPENMRIIDILKPEMDKLSKEEERIHAINNLKNSVNSKPPIAAIPAKSNHASPNNNHNNSKISKEIKTDQMISTDKGKQSSIKYGKPTNILPNNDELTVPPTQAKKSAIDEELFQLLNKYYPTSHTNNYMKLNQSTATEALTTVFISNSKNSLSKSSLVLVDDESDHEQGKEKHYLSDSSSDSEETFGESFVPKKIPEKNNNKKNNFNHHTENSSEPITINNNTSSSSTSRWHKSSIIRDLLSPIQRFSQNILNSGSNNSNKNSEYFMKNRSTSYVEPTEKSPIAISNRKSSSNSICLEDLKRSNQDISNLDTTILPKSSKNSNPNLQASPLSDSPNAASPNNLYPNTKNYNNNSSENDETNANPTNNEKYHKCEEVLGKGANAVVKLAKSSYTGNIKNLSDEKFYAIKEFRKRRKNEPYKVYIKKVISEFCISSSIKHQNVVETVDLIQDENENWCEVMEYCSGGDLYSRINTGTLTDTHEINCYFKQLLTGVAYLHSVGVCHRDIKPENLLMDESGKILKITDFGVSEVFRFPWEKGVVKRVNGLCGSEPYIAPEEWSEDADYDPIKVDIWACAIVYYTMNHMSVPWRQANSNDKYYDYYLNHITNFAPLEELPKYTRDVIYHMLDPNPESRWPMEKIIESDWVQGICACGGKEYEGKGNLIKGDYHDHTTRWKLNI